MKETVKETTPKKPKRAKRIRKELAAKKAAAKPPVVEPDQVDEYDEAAVKAMVAKTPEVRFYHSQHFTDDEDRIIAASIKGGIQLYKVAASLKCCYPTLKKHIDNTPILAEMVKEAREIECGELREAVKDLITMRHPQVVMWRARQLMPNEFGDAVETEEDDTRIVIGAIPEDLIAEADLRLSQAAEKPPEVGLAAMMAVREGEVEKAKGEEKAKAKGEGEGEGQSDTTPVSRDTHVAPVDQLPEDPAETGADEAEAEEEDVFLDDGFDFSGGDDLGF